MKINVRTTKISEQEISNPFYYEYRDENYQRVFGKLADNLQIEIAQISEEKYSIVVKSIDVAEFPEYVNESSPGQFEMIKFDFVNFLKPIF